MTKTPIVKISYSMPRLQTNKRMLDYSPYIHKKKSQKIYEETMGKRKKEILEKIRQRMERDKEREPSINKEFAIIAETISNSSNDIFDSANNDDLIAKNKSDNLEIKKKLFIGKNIIMDYYKKGRLKDI